MKQVVILVPNEDVNLSSITGTYEILKRANEYWQRLGNESGMTIQVAGYGEELKLDAGLFTIHPVHIKQISKTDLVIIPSLACRDFDIIIQQNLELVDWIKDQYKNGA